MRIFLDTNILLDTILDRDERRWRDDAETILQLGKDGTVELYMSTLSIPTIAYVLRGMTASSKRSVIRRLCDIVAVLPSLPEHVERILSGQMHDIEDALQVQSAKEGACELIVTRNKKDFAESDMPVLSPAEFLARVLA